MHDVAGGISLSTILSDVFSNSHAGGAVALFAGVGMAASLLVSVTKRFGRTRKETRDDAASDNATKKEPEAKERKPSSRAERVKVGVAVVFASAVLAVLLLATAIYVIVGIGVAFTVLCVLFAFGGPHGRPMKNKAYDRERKWILKRALTMAAMRAVMKLHAMVFWKRSFWEAGCQEVADLVDFIEKEAKNTVMLAVGVFGFVLAIARQFWRVLFILAIVATVTMAIELSLRGHVAIGRDRPPAGIMVVIAGGAVALFGYLRRRWQSFRDLESR